MSVCAWIKSSLHADYFRHAWRFSLTNNESGGTGDQILAAELKPNTLNIISSLDSDPTFACTVSLTADMTN